MDEILKRQPHASYRAKWADYRKRQILYWVLLLSLIPGINMGGYALERVFGSTIVYDILAGVWVAAIILSGTYKTNWKCPRCGKTFFDSWWARHSLRSAKKCFFCQLPIWAMSDPDAGPKQT
jgi:hypothetical protein